MFLGIFIITNKKIHTDKVMLKCAPSLGARHGVDLYVQIDNELYYYDSLLHCLLFDTATTKSNFIKFHITFNPSIYMWRYKHSTCIYDIFRPWSYLWYFKNGIFTNEHFF